MDSSFFVGFGVAAFLVLVGYAGIKVHQLHTELMRFMVKDEDRMKALDGACVKLANESASIRQSVLDIYAAVKGTGDDETDAQWDRQYKALVNGYMESGWDQDAAQREASRVILDKMGKVAY